MDCEELREALATYTANKDGVLAGLNEEDFEQLYITANLFLKVLADEAWRRQREWTDQDDNLFE